MSNTASLTTNVDESSSSMESTQLSDASSGYSSEEIDLRDEMISSDNNDDEQENNEQSDNKDNDDIDYDQKALFDKNFIEHLKRLDSALPDDEPLEILVENDNGDDYHNEKRILLATDLDDELDWIQARNQLLRERDEDEENLPLSEKEIQGRIQLNRDFPIVYDSIVDSGNFKDLDDYLSGNGITF